MKLLAVSIAVVSLVAGASAASLKEQIKSSNKEIAKTLMKKDLAAFEKMVKKGITSDFKYTEDGHSMTFDQMMATMKQSFASISKMTSADSKLLSFSQKGSSATAKNKHTMKFDMVGPDKKTHKMVMAGTSLDTYRLVGKEWKMASMAWSNNEMTMDGKPFDPTKMGG